MKVIICKFSHEKGIETKIRRIASREKRQAGIVLRTFCATEQVQKRLEAAGIPSEVLYDFHSLDSPDDETNWDKAYALSDELQASAETDNSLKYAGINFLTFEHHIEKYVFAIKFANLCKRMAAENCEVLLLVLTGQYINWLVNVNSSKIKTVSFGRTSAFLAMVRMQGYRLIREAYLRLASYLRKPAMKRRVTSTQEKDRSQTQTKALFVVSSTLYTRPALAIGEECLSNGLTPYICAVTDNMALLPVLQRSHIEYSVKSPLSISPIFSLSHVIRIILLLFRLRRHVDLFYDKSNPGAKPDEFSAEYLCKRTLLRELPKLCYQAVSMVSFLEKSIDAVSPEIVCPMDYSQFLQQMASALAKKHNIPTLTCSAAWETSNTHSFRRHLHADKIAVMGERMKRLYVASGVEPERIVPTGIAHFDLIFKRNRELDGKILRESGIDPTNTMVVFATDPPTSVSVERMHSVINAILTMRDVHLVVKVHPGERIEPYQAAVEQYHDPRIHVVRDIDLYALINRCALWVTTYSTTALEAMMIDKPVVSINLSGRPFPVPYVEEGAAFGVYKLADIESAISKSLYDGETRDRFKAGRGKFVRAWAGEPDGKASLRIVNLMKEMIQSNKYRTKHGKN